MDWMPSLFLSGFRRITFCVDLAKQLVSGPWLEKTGKDIEGLPQQKYGNDCGIFMIMYAWYLIMDAPFDFTVDDMAALRRWWCAVLVENLHLEGHGRRFAHFSKEAESMLNGLLSPVFRVKRKREDTAVSNVQEGVTSQGEDINGEEMVEEAQEKRKQQCSVLIDFLTGNTKLRQHLEAITTGYLRLPWEGKKERATTYFDDDMQLDEVVSFLFGILKDTPGARQLLDPVAFVFDVLLPETVIYSLEVHSLSVSH
ncbi:uncharacterized protein LOC126406522 [Epinephelus moara]|uniref:uncharacterized protein LOC126406522 n=1 Tax=Epinephelus moara TaxID=300413 RepID=UPI00214ECF88|nr:uncharacterized protein LOC126406522 [Epinephelus moara]